jgi:HD superfamily phosphohydrolase YqeK
MTSKERIDLFQRELSYIADDELREFAKQLLRDAHEYFFTVPASSSGKYHPNFARGEGGLVRHTKAVAYFVNELIRPEIEFGTIDRRDADLLIVAAIAHDIKKQGDGLEGHTVKEHPIMAANYVTRTYHEYEWKTIDVTDLNLLCEVIKSHMGPWQEPKPTSRRQLILFYADYIASRKEIVGIDFIDSGNNEAVEAYVPPVMTVEGYKFDFGKTKGMTIKEAYEKEPGYVKWIANKEGFGNVEVQKLVREFLDNR